MPDMEDKEYAITYCKFAPRCPYATEECRQKRPDMVQLNSRRKFSASTRWSSRSDSWLCGHMHCTYLYRGQVGLFPILLFEQEMPYLRKAVLFDISRLDLQLSADSCRIANRCQALHSTARPWYFRSIRIFRCRKQTVRCHTIGNIYMLCMAMIAQYVCAYVLTAI